MHLNKWGWSDLALTSEKNHQKCYCYHYFLRKKKTYLIFDNFEGSHGHTNWSRLMKLTSAIAILCSYLLKKFQVNWRRNKGGCQWCVCQKTVKIQVFRYFRPERLQIGQKQLQKWILRPKLRLEWVFGHFLFSQKIDQIRFSGTWVQSYHALSRI